MGVDWRTRRQAEILKQIRDERLWVGQGDRDLDAWAWRVLHLNRPVVTRMLGIAYGPVGGGGRRTGPTPGQGDGASRAQPPRARAQVGEVEGTPQNGDVSTSPPPSERVATATDFVRWVARQLERLERRGVPRIVAGLPPAERAGARRVLVGLADILVGCERAIAIEEEDSTDADA